MSDEKYRVASIYCRIIDEYKQGPCAEELRNFYCDIFRFDRKMLSLEDAQSRVQAIESYFSMKENHRKTNENLPKEDPLKEEGEIDLS